MNFYSISKNYPLMSWWKFCIYFFFLRLLRSSDKGGQMNSFWNSGKYLFCILGGVSIDFWTKSARRLDFSFEKLGIKDFKRDILPKSF